MVKIIHTLNMWDYFNTFPIANHCLESWKKNSQNAEIKIWTENDKFISDEFSRSPFIRYLWSNNKFDDYARRIGSINYLKLYILYNFGGMFLDADIEIKTPVSFSRSFTMNYAPNISPCSPIYFDEPFNPALKENLDFYNDVENIENDIFDWNMSDAVHFSTPTQQIIYEMAEAGISENVQYNHWISLFYDNGPKFWLTRKIDEMKYFSTQKDFDEYLKVNLFPDIHKKFENFKFIFIAEDLITPFLFTTSQNIKILKADKSICEKYLNFYLQKNIIFGENNELQLQ